MSTNIYIGNLAFSTTTSELESMFSGFGEVSSAQVVTDRETGRSRGFGFVEMSSNQAAQSAISELNGKDVGGRSLKVNLAKPRSR